MLSTVSSLQPPSTWSLASSSLAYENIQIQTALESLVADRHFCLQTSDLRRQGGQLYWKAHIVIWFTRANWQKKRVKAWVFNSGRKRVLKDSFSENKYFRFPPVVQLRKIDYTQWVSPQCKSITQYWRLIRRRSMYTSSFVYRRTANLQQGILPAFGANLLPLLAEYAKTKRIILHLSYSCLPLRRGGQGGRKRFPYYKRASFFRPSLQVFSFLFRTPGKPSLISHFIKHQVQTNYRDRRKMKWFLNFITEIIDFYWKKSSRLVAGLCIQINGRLNRRDRKFNLKRTYSVGKLGLTSTQANITYSDSIAFTKNGQVKIRVWVNYGSYTTSRFSLLSSKISTKVLRPKKFAKRIQKLVWLKKNKKKLTGQNCSRLRK